MGQAARGCSPREPEGDFVLRQSFLFCSFLFHSLAAVPPWLVFLLVSGTDFLPLPPPPREGLLCRLLQTSLSATFFPPYSSLPTRPPHSLLPLLPLLFPRVPRPPLAPRQPPRLPRVAAFGDVLPSGVPCPGHRGHRLPHADLASTLEPGRGQVRGTQEQNSQGYLPAWAAREFRKAPRGWSCPGARLERLAGARGPGRAFAHAWLLLVSPSPPDGLEASSETETL